MRPASDRAWDDETETVADVAPRRRRRSSKPDSAAVPKGLSRRGLRLFYFTLASLWGFLAGSVAILGGLHVGGYPLALDTGLSILVAIAAVLAVVGGVVAASAYRDAAHRR